MDFRVPDVFGGPPVDDVGCVENVGSNPTDLYYPCQQAYPDMQYGVDLRNGSIDVLVPFVGEGGPFPQTAFNYYVEWDANAPDIFTSGDLAARGAHQNSFFTTIIGQVDVIMKVSVQVYCEPDPGDQAVGRYTLHIHYYLRRMDVSPPYRDSEAFMICRSKFNWMPDPRCEPYFLWQQGGERFAFPGDTEEGYNCSENGRGRASQANSTCSYRPFVALHAYDGTQVDRYLDLSWPCFEDPPITVRDWDCDDPPPPIGPGRPDPVPHAPWQLECCPGRTQYASSIPASIVGADSGPPFTPGCSCLTGEWAFNFQADVNYRNWIGSAKPGYQGTFGLGACLGDYNAVTVLVYCLDGFSWAVIAKFNAPLALGLPDIDVGTILQVAPCTPPNRDNYFEVVLIMNPGTSCAGGCPCYGGALIIANG